MNYQEFLNYMKDNFLEYLLRYEKKEGKIHCNVPKEEVESAEEEFTEDFLENQYTIELHQIIKNNGIKLDGLIIRRNNEAVSPNIYLNSYFDAYQLGKPLHSIMEEIAQQYFLVRQEQDIQVDDLLDFNAIQNQIIIRLVNYEKNRELLKDSPYKRFLDLAVTYRYMAKRDEYGLASSLIRYEEFQHWGIDEEELYRIALFNTMREFPWHMESLAKVILDCLKRTMPEEDREELDFEFNQLEDTENQVNMYVLSNDSDLNGASCILYDSVIRNFAKVQNKNIIILPSSIHEVILVPESDDTDIAFLQRLVIDANQSAVGLIDLLSDSVYYYQLDKDEITIYGKSI